jgi:hypothetical protein
MQIFLGGASQNIATSKSYNSGNNRAFYAAILKKALGLDELATAITSQLASLKQDVASNGDWISGCVGAIVATSLWILSRCEAVLAFVTALL